MQMNNNISLTQQMEKLNKKKDIEISSSVVSEVLHFLEL